MLRNFFNKKSIVVLSICVLLIAGVTIGFLTKNAFSDDVPFIQMTDAQRREVAQQRYSTFSKNPDAVTEVLISFDNATSSDVLIILPPDVEVIACFHYFGSGDKVAAGGYFGCKDKTVSQVMSDYYQSIYNTLSNTKNKSEADRRQLEEMEQGKFMISGIRIKANNATLSALTKVDKVYSIEIIDNGLEKMGVGMVNPVILCD